MQSDEPRQLKNEYTNPLIFVFSEYTAFNVNIAYSEYSANNEYMVNYRIMSM